MLAGTARDLGRERFGGALGAGEDLGVVGEGLELEGVAGRVAHEHRPLLARLSLEADVRLDREPSARSAQPFGEAMELLDLEHEAEVRHRYVVVVHGVGGDVTARPPGREVGHQLVAAEVPVDPRPALPTLRAAEHRAVEPARVIEVIDADGEVEPRTSHAERR